MKRLSAALAVVVLSAWAAGCGVQGGEPSPPAEAAAAATAHARAPDDPLLLACAKVAEQSRAPVRCPEGIPAARGDERPAGRRFHVGERDLVAGDCGYLLELHARRAGRGGREPYHVLAGGRCTPFDLTASHGRWPSSRASDDATLRLLGRAPLRPGEDGPLEPVLPRVVERVRVGGEPGLLLRVEPFPAGGVHGGHLAVVWNRDGAGYVLSFHHRRRGERGGRGASEARSLLAAAATLSDAAPVERDAVPEATRDGAR